MTGLRIFLLLSLLWCLPTVSHAEDKWVADEIFLQMSEMREQIQQLQVKVAGLEQQLGGQPSAAPVSLHGSENMSEGKAHAQIVIIEFSDYECPFCGKHYQTVLPKLRESYIDKGLVKYVMKDFPLEFHSHAKLASLSGRCAAEQKKFWPMHNLIFDEHGQVTEEFVANAASQLNLDITAFNKCLADPEQMEKIKQDITLGASLGINGTPAFLVGTIKNKQVINYKRLVGVQSFETFANIIDNLNKPN